MFNRALAAALVLAACGCGSTKARVATEQLLASDAVDRAVADIDFRPLAGEDVFLDTQYLLPGRSKTNRAIGYVDESYVISTLRQQLIGCGARLQDRVDDAEIVVEARVGALGTDSREIVYGLPASNAISAAASAASALGSAPPIPSIPEISLARRDDHSAAAKVAAFAYDRLTREPVWQSGLAVAKSDAKDTYVLGAGPFQRGSIYDGVRFAGREVRPRLLPGMPEDTPEAVALREPHLFRPCEPPAAIETVGHAELSDEPSSDAAED